MVQQGKSGGIKDLGNARPASGLSAEGLIKKINSAINQDGELTNNTGQPVWAVVQNDDRSFSVKELQPGETGQVEAVLVDTNGDGVPDHGARIFNGAGLPSRFDLEETENGMEIVSPNIVQGGLNGIFGTVSDMIHEGADYITLMPIDEFLDEFPKMAGVLDAQEEEPAVADAQDADADIIYAAAIELEDGDGPKTWQDENGTWHVTEKIADADVEAQSESEMEGYSVAGVDAEVQPHSAIYNPKSVIIVDNGKVPGALDAGKGAEAAMSPLFAQAAHGENFTEDTGIAKTHDAAPTPVVERAYT